MENLSTANFKKVFALLLILLAGYLYWKQ